MSNSVTKKCEWIFLASALVALAIPSGVRAQGGTSTATSKQGTTAKKRPAAASASTYDRLLLKPALLKAKAPEQYKVKFVTTRGEFTITVTRAWAPLGADRFYNLVRHHFYDNASVFRVVPNFVAQFGISAYPAVTSAWRSADIKDDPVTQSNKKGYITFASGGPDTRTTQVFINLRDNPDLDHRGFPPFGVVDGDGMNVVGMFYDQYGNDAGMDQDNISTKGKAYIDQRWPKLDVIKSATLLTAAPAATSKPATAAKPKP